MRMSERDVVLAERWMKEAKMTLLNGAAVVQTQTGVCI
jgi:hypothetical protein